LKPLVPLYQTPVPRPVVAVKLPEPSQPRAALIKKVPSMMTRTETPTQSREAYMPEHPVLTLCMSQMRRNKPYLNPLTELNSIISRSMQSIPAQSKKKTKQSRLRFRVIRSRQTNLRVVGGKLMN
jgi:hypothetical protein